MYQKNLPNSELKKGSGSAIRQAFQVYSRLVCQPKHYKILRDEIGRLGYEFGSIILVAKRSLNGDVVSVHKTIWERCLKEDKKLLIYMAESGYFYRFEPKKIKETIENERGGQTMVNFSIREGKNLMKLRAERVKEDIIVDHNSDKYLEYLNKLGVFG